MLLKKTFETLRVRLGRQVSAERGGQGSDAVPSFRIFDNSADAGQAALIEKSGRGLIGSYHEIFDKTTGAVVQACLQIDNDTFRIENRLQVCGVECERTGFVPTKDL